MYVNSRAIIERQTTGGTEVLVQVRARPGAGGVSISIRLYPLYPA